MKNREVSKEIKRLSDNFKKSNKFSDKIILNNFIIKNYRIPAEPITEKEVLDNVLRLEGGSHIAIHIHEGLENIAVNVENGIVNIRVNPVYNKLVEKDLDLLSAKHFMEKYMTGKYEYPLEINLAMIEYKNYILVRIMEKIKKELNSSHEDGVKRGLVKAIDLLKENTNEF